MKTSGAAPQDPAAANDTSEPAVLFRKLTCVYVRERRSDRTGREHARVVITPSGNELIMSRFVDEEGQPPEAPAIRVATER